MEGLWHTHFNVGAAHGNGIAVLRNGELLGGDSSHIYVGSYYTDGPLLYLSVHVSDWLEEKAAISPEMPQAFLFSGLVQGDSAVLAGHPDAHLDVTVAVELHRAA